MKKEGLNLQHVLVILEKTIYLFMHLNLAKCL